MSEQAQANLALGEAIAGWGLPILVIVIGFAWAKHLNRSRAYGSSVRWPIPVSITIAALMLLQQCSREKGSSAQLSTEHKLIIEDKLSGESEPLPAAAMYAEDDLKAFSDFLEGEIARQFPDKANGLRAESKAIDAKRGTVVVSTLFSGNATVSRLYQGVSDRRLHVIGCYFADNRPLSGSDISVCHGRAASAFGNFVEVQAANGN